VAENTGRSIASSGYMLVRVGIDHPLADVRGYAYEHRVVAQEAIKRPLARGEHVHHKNGDKLDNRPENLEVLSAAEHRVEHRHSGRKRRLPGEANPETTCACGCGERLTVYDDSGRFRTYIQGHNPVASPARDSLLNALRNGPRSVRNLREQTGRTASCVRTILCGLARDGRVRRVSHGVYELNNAVEVENG